MGTERERIPRNDFNFGTAGEVDSKEGRAHDEGLLLAKPNYCSEAEAPHIELNGAIGEALQPLMHCVRSKLLFNFSINDPFLD